MVSKSGRSLPIFEGGICYGPTLPQHTKINVEVFRRLINAYLSRKFDAFSEYYSTLPAWDGKDHIAHLSDTIKPIELSHSKQWSCTYGGGLLASLQPHHGKNQIIRWVIEGEQGVVKHGG